MILLMKGNTTINCDAIIKGKNYNYEKRLANQLGILCRVP